MTPKTGSAISMPTVRLKDLPGWIYTALVPIAVGLILLLSPNVWVGVLITAAFAGLIFSLLWPEVGLGFLVARAPLYLGNLVSLQLGGTGVGISMVVVGAYYVVCNGLVISDLLNVHFISQFLLWVLLAARSVGAVDPAFASLKVRGFPSRSLLPVLLIPIVGKHRRNFQRLTWIFIGTYGLTALLGWLSPSAQYEPAEVLRLGGAKLNPIWYGRICGFAILFIIWRLLTHQDRWVLRAPMAGALFGLAVTVFWTGTRQVPIALMMAVLLVAILSARRHWWQVIIILAVTFGLALLAWPQVEFGLRQRLLSVIHMDFQSLHTYARPALWAQSYQMFLDRPLLGFGTGACAQGLTYYDWPHNVILEMAAEQGLVGLGLFIAFLVSVVVWGIRAMRSSASGSRQRQWQVFFLASFFYFFLLAMLSGYTNTNVELWSTGSLVIGHARGILTNESEQTAAV